MADEAAEQLAAAWWRGDGPPPPEFVEQVSGTTACAFLRLRLAFFALAAAVREATRWN